MEQYGGNLEAFILDVGDATKITAVLCHNFNAVELLGLRELMLQHDVKRIKEYETYWRSIHGEPKFAKEVLAAKANIETAPPLVQLVQLERKLVRAA